MTFNELVECQYGRGYIYTEDDLSIYMRRTKHALHENMLDATLDVANINLPEAKRGKGIFTAWLTDVLEPKAAELGRAVYVESLHNKQLYAFLLRRGYVDAHRSDPRCPSVYKQFNKGVEE